MRFEWDAAKEAANRRKHGLGFRLASRVFLDPFAIEFEDLTTREEQRFNVIGMVDDRLLYVTYTPRDDVVRIISARGAERNERKRYHELST
jgi:uncharacterized DUF497 family protein